MVRTRADNCSRKAVASKAPRKNFNAGGSSGASSSYGDSPARNHPGAPSVNHAKMWPTPKWQKGIGTFFNKKESNSDEGCSSSSSSGSNSPTNERIETSEVIVQNTPSLEVTDDKDRQISDDRTNVIPETPEENTITSNISLEDSNEESLSVPKSKKKLSGKAKAGPASTNRKRRVVIADSSDEDN